MCKKYRGNKLMIAFLGPTINDRIKRKNVYLWDPAKRA